jgi:hypothetical protein
MILQFHSHLKLWLYIPMQKMEVGIASFCYYEQFQKYKLRENNSESSLTRHWAQTITNLWPVLCHYTHIFTEANPSLFL